MANQILVLTLPELTVAFTPYGRASTITGSAAFLFLPEGPRLPAEET